MGPSLESQFQDDKKLPPGVHEWLAVHQYRRCYLLQGSPPHQKWVGYPFREANFPHVQIMMKMWMTTVGYPVQGALGMVHAIAATVLPVELFVIEDDFQTLIIDSVVHAVST